MSEPFLSEIQLFGFNFPPRGWAQCNGATIAIQQNTALFALLGVNYGGNGQTTFQLPNFAARAAASRGQGPGLSPRTLGVPFGVRTVALTTNELPAHRHVVRASVGPGTTSSPANSLPASSEEQLLYDAAVTAPMVGLSTTGSGLGHTNEQPYLGVNFCIALTGIFPPRQ